ncbi:MAG: hypothetical protein IKH15_04850 [Bacteroidales bacterium]|nr:hypothetical protein [Bacteroidales bacterium]
MTAFEEYVDQYGCHFNKKLYEWAVSMMDARNGGKVKTQEKDAVLETLKKYGVTIDNNKGHDVPYVWAMGTADYLGDSVPDEMHLAKFVKNFLDDPDGTETKAFDHFVVDCRQKGEPIFWDEML